jgi:hypothetical protein
MSGLGHDYLLTNDELHDIILEKISIGKSAEKDLMGH